MSRGLACALALVALPVLAAPMPASIQDARIETGSDTPAAAIARVGRGETTEWVAWSVPALPGAATACCFANDFGTRGCTLSDRETSWGTTLADDAKQAGELHVLVGVRNSRPLRVQVVSSSCPIHGEGRRVVWLEAVAPDASLDALARLLDAKDDEIRRQALFALSQVSAPGAADRIKRAAVEDKDPDVRAHALFCLSQTRTTGAGEWIVHRLDAEHDDQVREQAVFALSQLPDGTDWLLRVLRGKRDPRATRRALFWLAQSEDPRALEEIEKILAR